VFSATGGYNIRGPGIGIRGPRRSFVVLGYVGATEEMVEY
jgi:hypothetical protein